MKNHSEILFCPCCESERPLNQCQYLMKCHKQFKSKFIKSVLKCAREKILDWACDICIREGKAVLANPDNQNFIGIVYPYFVYYDQNKICHTCQQSFIFTKEEQHFWYEELKFNVHSEAKNCPKCRKESREKNRASVEISRLIKDLKNDDFEQIHKLIKWYLSINRVDKAKYYLSVFRKNSPKNEETERKINFLNEIINR